MSPNAPTEQYSRTWVDMTGSEPPPPRLEPIAQLLWPVSVGEYPLSTQTCRFTSILFEFWQIRITCV